MSSQPIYPYFKDIQGFQDTFLQIFHVSTIMTKADISVPVQII